MMNTQNSLASVKTNPIRALILDDEIDACRNLEILLTRYWSDSIHIVGVVQSTEEAELNIQRMKPEVLFIDIEMPEENAFHFLERIDRTSFEIIFVTAYDEYALRALKLNAIDYILKPISLEELDASIKKLTERILMRQKSEGIVPIQNLSHLAEQINKKQVFDSLVLRTKSEIIALNFNEIVYLEAIGGYTNFYYVKDKKLELILISYPLVDYEELLPSFSFFRIHKSFIINTFFVKKVSRGEQYQVEMNFDIVLPISRRRHQSFIEFLKQKS